MELGLTGEPLLLAGRVVCAMTHCWYPQDHLSTFLDC